METITIKRANSKWQATLNNGTTSMVVYASTLVSLLENIKLLTKDWE